MFSWLSPQKKDAVTPVVIGMPLADDLRSKVRYSPEKKPAGYKNVNSSSLDFSQTQIKTIKNTNLTPK